MMYRPTPRLPIEPAEYPPPAGFVDYWDWTRNIADSAAAVRTGRLAPWLRQIVQGSDVMTRLRDAAWRLMDLTRSTSEIESRAWADLAVTGRASYGQFSQLLPSDEAVLATLMAVDPSLNRSRAREAVRQTLDRAYSVAWAVRGAPRHREIGRAHV